MKNASVCVGDGFLGVVRTTVRPSRAIGGVREPLESSGPLASE